MSEVRFDDIDSLGALVSDGEFDAFGPAIEITQDRIDQFAELTGDRQWIHVDRERCARDSPLGKPIAHGFLVLSLITALTEGAAAQIVGFGQAIHYGADQLRFLKPVPAGSQVQARRRVAHVRKKGIGGSQLTFETEVCVVGDDRPALTYRSIVVFLP
ncbi:MAG: MaoC family dehydratase [Deltaproteobacteria bacterium]|nr:MaoC family dehydratase [Deltaproteobacteria bacterium]